MGELPQPVPGPKISHSSIHPIWPPYYQRDQRRSGGRKNKKHKIREFCEQALGLKELEYERRRTEVRREEGRKTGGQEDEIALYEFPPETGEDTKFCAHDFTRSSKSNKHY